MIYKVCTVHGYADKLGTIKDVHVGVGTILWSGPTSRKIHLKSSPGVTFQLLSPQKYWLMYGFIRGGYIGMSLTMSQKYEKFEKA